MADEVDDANALSELFLQQALANRNTGTRLVARGNCHYCETVFAYNPTKLDEDTDAFFAGREVAPGTWAAKRAELAAAVVDEDLDTLVDAAMAGLDLKGRSVAEVRPEVREELARKRNFCNADCAQDHEYEQKLKARR
jgi:hypothetical protein